jgi:RNA polymerase sigma-70 factor (ECF subfamily)
MSPETTAEEFLRYRTRLLGVAYRLLGSMWDAEDVVSEAMVRWLRIDSTEVHEPLAYLTTMVTRLALDQLKSAHATRQSYVGTWLPEPTLTKTAELGPLDTVELRDSVSLATLHVMEQLTPPERGVFVLREAFELSFAQIAEILEMTETGARQLLHRARGRIARDEARFHADPSEHAAFLDRFLRAVGDGELTDLEDLLASDAISYSDGGGRVRAAIRPIVGRDNVLKFLRGLLRRFAVHDIRIVEANGLPAAFLWFGRLPELLTLEVVDHRIQTVFGILNPDKLTHVERQLRDSGAEVVTRVR